jgi:hypothetical protein
LQKYKIFQIFNGWYPRNCCLHELHREIMVKTICQIWDKMFLNEWIDKITWDDEIPEEQCRRRRTTKNTLKIFFFFGKKEERIYMFETTLREGHVEFNFVCLWMLLEPSGFRALFLALYRLFFLYFNIFLFLFQVLKN